MLNASNAGNNNAALEGGVFILKFNDLRNQA
jgi:hypothetical protein